jgi:hypothetical protein
MARLVVNSFGLNARRPRLFSMAFVVLAITALIVFTAITVHRCSAGGVEVFCNQIALCHFPLPIWCVVDLFYRNVK